MEERKSSNKLLTTLVIILLIAVLGLTGFVVYDKVLKKDKVEPNTTDNSDNERNGNEEIKDLNIYDDIVLKLTYPSKILWFKTSDKNWDYEDFKVDSANRYAMMQIAAANVKCIDDDDKVNAKCSAKEIESNFKKIFGPDMNYYNGDVEESNTCLDIGEYKDGAYIRQRGCGGDSVYSTIIYTKTYKAQQTEDNIYVYEYVQSVTVGLKDPMNYQSDGVAYLLDKQGNKLEEIDYDNYESIARKRINDGKADTYKWTFKKQSDGNYYFYSGNWE